MNLAFVCKEMYPYFHGGIGVQFWLLMRHYRSLGHQIVFFTRRPSTLPHEWNRSDYEGIRVEFVSSDSDPMPAPAILGYALAVRAAVCRYLASEPVEAIFTAEFEAEGLFLGAGVPQGDGRIVPVITTLHGNSASITLHDGRTPNANDRLIQGLENQVMSQSLLLVSPSRRLLQDITARLSISSNRFRVIPNLANADLFDGARAPPPRQPKIVFVGRLQRIKGADRLLSAFVAHQTQSKTEAVLHLIGRDLDWAEYGCSFQRYWEQRLPRELRKRVKFLGTQSQAAIRRELASASVAVFPSRWEAFGIVALEALHAGVPVILPADTGMAEVVEPAYPLLFTGDDPTAEISALLESVLGDPAAAEKMRPALQQRARTLHQQANSAYVDLLTELPALAASPELLDASAQSKILLESFEALQNWVGLRETDFVRAEAQQANALDALQLNVEARDQRISELDHSIEQRDGTILRVKAEHQELATLIARQEATIMGLESRLEQKQAQSTRAVAKARQAITEQEDAIRQLQAALVKAEQEVKRLCAQINAGDAAITKRDQAILKLESALVKTEKELERLTRQVLARDQAITKLEAALGKTEKEVYRVAQQVIERDQVIQKTSTMLAKTEEKMQRLDQQIIKRDEQITQRDARLKKAAEEIDDLTKEVLRRDREILDRDKQIARLSRPTSPET
jgi:glycosyltransferase involved in cell wall biosynthesis/peptidoglycan hydrolase CwlO-like protein